MANASPSRIGQANLSGATDELFLEVFGGEVLSAFEEANKSLDKHTIRTIESGKSASFPATWKGGAAYHTPGTELVGTAVAHNERTILIDDVLIADRFIAEIDEAKNHWDVRGEYTRDVGRALARTFDKNVLQVGLLAARASATVTGGNGGTQITAATAKTNAQVLVDSIFAAAQAFDEKDVPEEDRFVYIKPAQYNLLANSSLAIIDRDFGGEGNGGPSSGKVYTVAGMTLVKTNNLPQAVVNTGPTAYQGIFTNTAALVMNRGAVGTLKLLDLATEMAWDIRRQGTLVLAKYAMGHGILRPECSVEIKTA